MLSIRRFSLPLLCLLLSQCALLGCGGNKNVLEFDQRFSINLIRTPPVFPPPKTEVSPAEDEVLFRRGNPDFIRIWWRDDGRFITTSDLTGQSPETVSSKLEANKKSWIYLYDNEEVVFTGEKSGYHVQQLDSLTRLIAEFGDPDEKKKPVKVGNSIKETWVWLQHGFMVDLIDGLEVDRHYFGQGTGIGTTLK